MKRKFNVFLIIPFIFAFTGIVLLIVSCFLFGYNRRAKANSVQVEGTISAIEVSRTNTTSAKKSSANSTTHSVYVDYEYEGKTYGKVHINYYTSSMYEGAPITLYIDPKKPSKVMNVTGSLIGVLVTGPIGILFALAGGIVLVVMLRADKVKQEILTNGRSIFAKITRISVNRNVRVNGRNPYRILCVYEEYGTGVTQEFLSDNIYTDPTVRYRVGDDIEVRYLDNFDKYCVVVNL